MGRTRVTVADRIALARNICRSRGYHLRMVIKAHDGRPHYVGAPVNCDTKAPWSLYAVDPQTGQVVLLGNHNYPPYRTRIGRQLERLVRLVQGTPKDCKVFKVHDWPPELIQQVEAIAEAQGRSVQSVLETAVQLGLRQIPNPVVVPRKSRTTVGRKVVRKSHRWPPDLYKTVDSLAVEYRRPRQQVFNTAIRIGLKHIVARQTQTKRSLAATS